MTLSEEQLKIIADNPLNNVLAQFPDLLRTLPESTEAWRADVAALLWTLIESPAAFKLPLSAGSGDVGTRLFPIRQKVAFGVPPSFSHFRPLIDAVVTKSSDTDVWTAVCNLVETLNPSTPSSTYIITAAFEIPVSSCLERVANREIHDTVERELFSEIRRCRPWGLVACTSMDDDAIGLDRSMEQKNSENIIRGTTGLSNMARLPPEILLEVLQYLSKSDLKAVRLVCKNMRDLPSKFLFQTVYASVHLTDLAVLLNISADPIFRLAVREVVYTGVFFNSSTDSNSDAGTQYYCKRYDEQVRLLKAKINDQYITAALASMPNVRRVTLTNHWSPTKELLEECSFAKRCLGKIIVEDHVGIGPPLSRAYPADLEEPDGRPLELPLQDSSHVDIDYGFWMMCNAVFSAKTQIQELVIDYDYYPRHLGSRYVTCGISPYTFNLPSESVDSFAEAFRHLRRIAFSLCKPACPQTRGILLKGSLGNFLASAHGLEELTLDFDNMEDRIPLHALIGTHCWPRLRLLRLYRKQAKEEELNELIQRHSKSLKVLKLGGITLSHGTWQAVAEMWHSWLQLEEIRCEQLMELKDYSTMEIDCDEFKKHIIYGESAPLQPSIPAPTHDDDTDLVNLWSGSE